MSSLNQLIRWANVFSASSMTIYFNSRSAHVSVVFHKATGTPKTIDGQWKTLISEIIALHPRLNLDLVVERLKIHQRNEIEWRARVSHYPDGTGGHAFQFDLLKISNSNIKYQPPAHLIPSS